MPPAYVKPLESFAPDYWIIRVELRDGPLHVKRPPISLC